MREKGLHWPKNSSVKIAAKMGKNADFKDFSAKDPAISANGELNSVRRYLSAIRQNN